MLYAFDDPKRLSKFGHNPLRTGTLKRLLYRHVICTRHTSFIPPVIKILESWKEQRIELFCNFTAVVHI